MTHPRDHTLVLSAQLRSDMTTLANVTCKVRVNGGTATTYTNVSSPAITQYSDLTSGYELKIAANTYADADVVEVTWLYSGTAYAIDSQTIGPAAVDGAHFTNARGDLLSNIDATVSSRSTYAGADTAGTTTLLSRLTGGRATNLDNLDVAVSTRSTVVAIWAAAVDSAGVTTLLARLSATRAGYLDNLTNLDAAVSGLAASVWAAGARTLTSISDSSGVTTLLGRLSSGRAAALDHLDADVSSRLATSGYTAPDNSTVAALKTELDAIRADYTTGRAANLDQLDAAVSSRLATSGYTAPHNSNIDDIKAKTDNLPGDPASESGLSGIVAPVLAGVHALLARFSSVRVLAPAVQVDRIDLIEGNDYKAEDGRALEFSSVSWPDLTDATVVLTIGSHDALDLDGVITGDTDDGFTVSVDVTRDQVDGLRAQQEYELMATLASDSQVTLSHGVCTVTE